MRLTKKKAVELTREMWAWIAETGAHYKGNWPGWEKCGFDKYEVDNYCFLCEYAQRKEVDDYCENCPLLGLWVAGVIDSTCLGDEEPFAIWEYAVAEGGYEDKRDAALQIVAACDRWLKK